MAETTSGSGSVSQAVTIIPRLDYSVELLSGILGEMGSRTTEIRTSNRELLKAAGGPSMELEDGIRLERVTAFSIEVLTQILHKIRRVSAMQGILKILPPAIPAIRTVSAQIHAFMPATSKKLSELSVHLGSIALDAAILSTAKFDFGRSNSESVLFLDKVKLMIDSKINKQYRNLAVLRHQAV